MIANTGPDHSTDSRPAHGVVAGSPALRHRRAGGRYASAKRTAAIGGMIAASFVGIFLIPMLYVTIQWIRERLKDGWRGGAPAAPLQTPTPATGAAQ